jgi:diguanylate cyclase (GGDEF)-like protein
MKLRRQTVDLRSFLGQEIPLTELSPDLRQRVRHALAVSGDLQEVTAAVVRELLDRGRLRPAGIVREGSERITVYSLPHARRVFDLRPLLGEPDENALTPARGESTVPAPQTRASTAASSPPADSPTARLVPIDAIRRTLEQDWVSHGLDVSLEGVLQQLSEGLGDPRLEVWLWVDRLDLVLGDGARWRALSADAGQGIALRHLLVRTGDAPVLYEGRLGNAVRSGAEVVAAIGVDPRTPAADLLTAGRAVEALVHAYQRSQQRVYTDPLTGLHNRGFFESQLAVELERARRSNQPLALLFVDIDHFKRINDQHGHDVGDLVLQHVSRLMVQHLRRIDQVFRWGGEEFALLLPGTRRAEAQHTAERLRAVIERTPVLLGAGQEVGCTISVGIALAPEHAEGGERALLRHSDQALYAAKAGGRNRVVVYTAAID